MGGQRPEEEDRKEIKLLQINVGTCIFYQEPNRKIAKGKGLLLDRRGDVATQIINRAIRRSGYHAGEGFQRIVMAGITV